jgi:hypothetical protein
MGYGIAAGLAVALAAIGLAGSAAGEPRLQAEPPTVNCEDRIQVIGRAPRGGHNDLRFGPVYLTGLRQTGRRQPPSFFEPNGGRRFAVVKSPPVVDAGVVATLEVPGREAGRLEYEIAHDTTPHARGPTVRLEACAPDAEVAGKPVGPRTPFIGGIRVTGPGCYSIRVRVGGRAPVTRRVKLGVESCP